ncbi:hypothetical protein Hamer_G008697 [Homarus americanus]|uniref:Uncharacterized protein n=1 Tax=Homarus americanus TaxID=6706 RepID=A0A8J5TJA4_HOMAM|nr:hypothetical protein Hamer_G008697 [Homarus americanus]
MANSERRRHKLSTLITPLDNDGRTCSTKQHQQQQVQQVRRLTVASSASGDRTIKGVNDVNTLPG